MLKRLMGPSGEVLCAVDPASMLLDTMDRLVRPAILVHSGPEGLPITFMSSDGEISFDRARIERIVANQNKLLEDLESGYGGSEKTPIGAYPALLDQHRDDSNDCIRGRLNNRLWIEVRDVPQVGKNVVCAMTNITILGKENVERVKDGRIFHLSVGIKEESDTLGEASTVIEPAAAGAMLLSKSKGEKKMTTKMPSASSVKRLATLTSMKESLTQLSAKLVSSKETLSLAKRKSAVTHRLHGLLQGRKLTPAEFKKLDITRLAALKEEDFKTIADSYEVREDVIEAGQRGSTDAADASELAMNLEEKQMKRLKSETASDIVKLSGKKIKLKGLDDDSIEAKLAADGKTTKLAADGSHKEEHELADDEDAVEMKKCYAEMGKCLEAGDIEGAKTHYAKMSGGFANSTTKMSLGAVSSDEEVTEMANIQGQVDQLTTQTARIAGMVDELMTSEKEEEQMAAPAAEGGDGQAPAAPAAAPAAAAPAAEADDAQMKAELAAAQGKTEEKDPPPAAPAAEGGDKKE